MTEKPENSQSTTAPVAETTEEIADVISKLESNKKMVLVAILGLALAFSLVVVFRELASQKHLAAAEAYSLVAQSRSVEELDQVITDYPKSVAAGDALLTKTELQITSGKSKDALVTLLTFIEKYSKHPRHAQGVFALGNLYQIGGEAENAGKYFDRVLKEYPDSDIAPLAMIRQGDLLLAQGKKDEARQKYESILPAYRGTAFFERIEEKIALLDVEKLPVVPAPKEPEPASKASPPAAPKTVPKATPETAPSTAPTPSAPEKPAAKTGEKPLTPPTQNPSATTNSPQGKAEPSKPGQSPTPNAPGKTDEAKKPAQPVPPKD